MPRRNKTATHKPFKMAGSCQSKRQYINEREAQKAADYQMLINPNLELSIYKCDICQKWHLTKRANQ